MFISRLKVTEARIIEWKARNGINILRFSLGIVFLWFGVLKLFPGLSPAELLAGKTVTKLTFGLLKPSISLPALAIWECTIGLGFITKAWPRLTLILLYLQMAGTFLPLLFFPHETFSGSILIPTLLGQYIIKNLVLISGGIVIGGTLSGASLSTNIQANDNTHLQWTSVNAKKIVTEYITDESESLIQ